MGYPVESSEPLLDGEAAAPLKEYNHRAHSRSGRRGQFWTVGTFVLAILAFVLSCISSFKPELLHSKSVAVQERTWLDCGTTPEQAREKGCIFDPVFFAWQPAPCHFPDAMEWAIEAGNFTFYYDKELTQEVPDEVVRAGGPHSWLYTRKDFHYYHCGYLWVRQSRMLKALGWVTDLAMDVAHTEHCRDLLMSRDEGIHGEYSSGKVLYWKCLKM